MAPRRSRWLLLVCCACASSGTKPPAAPPPAPTAASTPALHGIEVGDLDRTVNPCSDFYQYANGSWRAANPIPPTQPRWSRRWAAGEANKDRLRVLLDETSSRSDWPLGSVEQLTGDFDLACMDTRAIDAAGWKPIQPLLSELARMTTRAQVTAMIGRLHAVDIAVPFRMASTQDFRDPTQVIAEISAGTQGMPDRDYYVGTEPRFVEAREKYLAHVEKLFGLVGFSPERARAAARTVMAMETAQARATLPRAALREPKNVDHPTTIAALQRLARAFPWKSYFQRAHLRVSRVNVTEPALLSEVDRQLRSRSVADWSIYLRWHVIREAAPSLSAPFDAESFAFERAYLGGEKEMAPRWKHCAEDADKLLGEALGKIYVQRYFPPEAKARMREMVDFLILGMKQSIEQLTWMSPETKQRALAKLAALNPKIGYPDRWKDYSRVQIGRSSHWSNVVAGRRFTVDDDRGLIGKPLDRSRWGLTTPTSNAYYNASLNEIVFPAGILEPPAFDLHAVDAVNYGAIGVVIGHEISHGFDDQGAQFDGQGRLSNWWTKEDLTEFQRRGRCVSEQFEGYLIEPGIHHNGKLVLGESIGDLAGAKIAWLGFQKSLEGKPPAPTLDGFTPEQQFWIAWGQFRGDDTRPEMKRKMVQSDPHPVAQFRVIGPLSNLPMFQSTFHCPDGSPMVRPPALRCEVW